MSTKGSVVVIHEDPLTCERAEGKAQLIRLLREDRLTETWTVKFLSDGFVCDRRIRKLVECTECGSLMPVSEGSVCLDCQAVTERSVAGG